MIRPVITGEPVLSPVMLVGQAPGIREGELQRPFAWTAGKTLFKWIETIGIDEQTFRQRVYMAAVCRCFPGKNPKGGDRVPDAGEIESCGTWLDTELALIRPQLVLAVGKLAIGQFMPVDRLADVVGQSTTARRAGLEFDVIALPHPSGASTWHRMEPGKRLLGQALRLTARHPAWEDVLNR